MEEWEVKKVDLKKNLWATFYLEGSRSSSKLMQVDADFQGDMREFKATYNGQ